MAESNSREVFFLKQVANQKYNKDFAVNMVQVNNTLKSISKYLIVMQQGIDDLNRDILEQIQDFISELIIIFNGGDFSELGLDFGHLKYVFRAIGAFFGFGQGLTGTGAMAKNFFEQFLAPFQWFGDAVGNAVDTVIDFILGLLSWIPGVGNARQKLANALNTTRDTAVAAQESNQELTNKVWEGATAQQAEGSMTEQQVRDAVAAMKAKSEALRRENELRYSSAVPNWQGLVPGGDVTCDLNTVSVRDNWRVDVDGQTADGGGFPGHFHGSGTFEAVINLGIPQSCMTSASGSNRSGPFAATRARSDASRNVLTFMARAIGSVTEAYASLWTYDEDNDRWMCVSVSSNFISQVPGIAEYGWVDAVLQQEYTPGVGDNIAVMWTSVGTGQLAIASSFGASDSSDQFSIPAYHSVPYGTRCHVTLSGQPVPGTTVSLPQNAGWKSGRTPFCQIAPNLGQTVEPTPQYWFDDFNAADPSAYNFSSGAKISSQGDFRYNGSSDGLQYLIYRGQMATPHHRIEATAKNHVGREMFMRLGCTPNGTSGVNMVIRGDSETTTELVLFTVSGSDASSLTERKRLTGIPKTSYDRWAIEFYEPSSTYLIYKDNNLVTNWADPGNLALRGKGKRTGGLGVARVLFASAGQWDDLFIHDVIPEEV
ncbi:minor tail protein [Gordonia phage Madi]|nr:minor tail protein [Gordonia phage Madi]